MRQDYLAAYEPYQLIIILSKIAKFIH